MPSKAAEENDDELILKLRQGLFSESRILNSAFPVLHHNGRLRKSYLLFFTTNLLRVPRCVVPILVVRRTRVDAAVDYITSEDEEGRYLSCNVQVRVPHVSREEGGGVALVQYGLSSTVSKTNIPCLLYRNNIDNI